MVTTHFLDEAEYCDRIALIYRGHVIAHGSPDELKDRVARRRAARADARGRLYRPGRRVRPRGAAMSLPHTNTRSRRSRPCERSQPEPRGARPASAAGGADPQGIAADPARPEQLPDRRRLAALVALHLRLWRLARPPAGPDRRGRRAAVARGRQLPGLVPATRGISRSASRGTEAPSSTTWSPASSRESSLLAADFSDRLGRGETAPIQVLVDGSDPNTAGLVQTYVQGLWSNWLEQEAAVQRPAGRPAQGRAAGRQPSRAPGSTPS